MLVLSRKANESIVCSELGVQIVVLPSSTRHNIRLGIIANTKDKFLRHELLLPEEIEKFEEVSEKTLSLPRK